MGVYARKDSPYWWLWIEPTGQRISSKVPVGTGYQRRESRKDAEDIYRAAMGDAARRKFKLPVALPIRTFRDQAEWYRDTISVHHRGARRVVSMIKKLIEHFGDERIGRMDTARIEEWKAARAREVSIQTVNRELDVLKPLLRSAVPTYLDASPADAVKRFRVRRFAPITILNHDDEDRLLKVATPEERAFILLGLDALMRQGDVRRLRAEHVKAAHLEIVDPKTAQPYKVPLSDRLKAALAAINPQDGWYFARKRKGKWQPITENTAYRLFTDLCTRAGVTVGRDAHGVTFHALRHTGTTRALKAVKATAVMRLGGWSSLRQLVRYDHPDEADMIAGVAAIGSRPIHAASAKTRKAPQKRRP